MTETRFQARFSSRCGGCGLRIDEGDLCEVDDGEVGHSGCAGAIPPPKVAPDLLDALQRSLDRAREDRKPS